MRIKMIESTQIVPDAKIFGQRLRWLRDFKEITLQEFASKIDCDPGYLSKLENDKAKNPSARFLGAVALIFRVNVAWLRTGEGDPFWTASTDERTKNALPNWSDKRYQRIFSVLDELPDALAIDAVLERLFRDQSLEEFQEIWREVMAIPDLPATARLFLNDVYVRFQIIKSNEESRGKLGLTNKVKTLTKETVQPVLPKLIQRLKRATEARGSKSELAQWLGVHRQSITDWLSGKQEPGGEITLKLLHWVEQQERQK
jgi:transcriptional regulator with XRE-family HTH domain